MKILISIVAFILSGNLLGQTEHAIDLLNTSYVVVKYDNYTKGAANVGLKFINTETGHTTHIKFAERTYISSIKHVKLDLLEINIVLVFSGKVSTKNSAGTYENTVQTFTVDGRLLNKVILNQFISDYVINNKTGRVVLIMGPNHFKNDSGSIPPSEIIYDLKTLQKI